MKIEYQDRIDEYLLHRMTDEERIAFENEVNSDNELQEQLSFTEDVRQSLSSRNEKLAKMKEWQDDYDWEEGNRVQAAEKYRATGSGYNNCPAPPMNETHSMPRSSGRKIFYWISGIAAMFVAGLFIIKTFHTTSTLDIPFMKSKTDQSLIQYGDVTFRGACNYQTIEDLLEKRNFKQVLEEIKKEELEIESQKEKLEKNYKLSRESKNIKGRIEILAYKQDNLNWLKAQALLGLNLKEDALILLDKIRHSKSEFKEQADSLYRVFK